MIYRNKAGMMWYGVVWYGMWQECYDVEWYGVI